MRSLKVALFAGAALAAAFTSANAADPGSATAAGESVDAKIDLRHRVNRSSIKIASSPSSYPWYGTALRTWALPNLAPST